MTPTKPRGIFVQSLSTKRMSHRNRLIFISVTAFAAAILRSVVATGEVFSSDIMTNEAASNAVACDVMVLDQVGALDSPLTLTFGCAVDADAGTFSYTSDMGQYLNGLPFSLATSGSGDPASGTYTWNSQITWGDDTITGTYSDSGSDDPTTWTSKVGGTILSPHFGNWVVSGTVTVTGGTPPTDAGTITGNRGNLNTQFTLSSYLKNDGSWGGTISRSVKPGITYDDTISSGLNSRLYLQTLPEPSTFVLLGIGAISLLGYAWRRRTRTA